MDINNLLIRTPDAIVFRKGDETGIVVEKEGFANSLFKGQYSQALTLIEEIVTKFPKEQKAEEVNSERHSNVIAFCGDRGEGKSSALVSLRYILSEEKCYQSACEDGLLATNSKIKLNTFKVLPMVDPAFFDNEHNLLELLLGQMYAQVKNAPTNCTDTFQMDSEYITRNYLLQQFQQVRASISIIRKATTTRNAYDELEQIDDLAAGMELKKQLAELLQTFAKFFGKERVLICIDDLDLNISEGYTMAEEIRKYLSSPQACVILMAIKVEQMEEVVRNFLRQRMNKDIILNPAIEEMAEKYVTKLLPQNHRVWTAL